MICSILNLLGEIDIIYLNVLVASNNLRDVMYYLEKYDIKHITTGDILKLALERGLTAFAP